MPPDLQDRARLWDMLDAGTAILEFLDNCTPEYYQNHRMLRNAVERNLEIIGEAARHLSPETRDLYPGIPWKSVIGLRNIIAHDYGEILNEKVWGICRNRLPDLIATLKSSGVGTPPDAPE